MTRKFLIGSEQYILKASLYTQISYKAHFGADLLADLVKADKLLSGNLEDQHGGRIIYLQAFYVLALEGEGDMLPFTDWLRSVDGADMPEIIKTVAELYASTTRADRKNG